MRHVCWPIVILLLTAACSPINVANRKMPSPFKSTPNEEANVDRLLARWEAWNAGIKTFDCRFKRWTYDATFGPRDQPQFVDLGTIKYAAPDHAIFRLDRTEKGDKDYPIEDARAEHCAFDGKSVIEWNHEKRLMTVYQLPPEATNVVDGPLDFRFCAVAFWSVFGVSTSPSPFPAKAKELKEQYYLREVTPRNAPHDQIWLEAYPRNGLLAASFHHLQLIFQASDMTPFAMKLTQPNGKDYVVYQFYDVTVNSPQKPGDDPFFPAKPLGWQKIVNQPPAIHL